jgi:signal transduction histidine kinase
VLPVRVLVLEDSPSDEVLLLSTLICAGFALEHECVCSADGLRDALARSHWDVVTSDYQMPGFDALEALAIVRETDADLPFIIVSGAVGEDVAVAAMKAGAQDYVMKDNLARLAPSVARELREAEVRRERLRAEAAARAADHERALAELKSAAKTSFLAHVSHELRTPLNGILGFTELLQAELGPRASARHLEYLELVHQSGRHLLRLISEILDLSTVEAGRLKLRREEVEVPQLLRSAIAELEPVAQQRHVELCLATLEPLPRIRLDPLRIRQVVTNLLSNAVKFSRSPARVLVRAEFANDRLAISVRDEGPGIKPEHLPRLFQSFERIPDSHPGVEGAGLGLALSKRLVELHGGALTVQSTWGEGSTFLVELPATAP